jgi:hypothetical protein
MKTLYAHVPRENGGALRGNSSTLSSVIEPVRGTQFEETYELVDAPFVPRDDCDIVAVQFDGEIVDAYAMHVLDAPGVYYHLPKTILNAGVARVLTHEEVMALARARIHFCAPPGDEIMRVSMERCTAQQRRAVYGRFLAAAYEEFAEQKSRAYR